MAHITKKGRKDILNRIFPKYYFLFEFLEIQEEIPCVEVVDKWEIRRENLTILEKKLGSGQFGIVMQGLIFRGKNESEVVAVKMLKGTKCCVINFMNEVF